MEIMLQAEILAGIIGWPVSHSLSPLMHRAAAAALGIELLYLLVPVRREELETAVRGLSVLGFRGANITVPYKEIVIPMLDVVDEAAQAIGAVNTIVVEGPSLGESGEMQAAMGRRLAGYNTDWSGFLADLRALDVETEDHNCLVLGAGGSARAVTYALASANGRVHVVARRMEQAQRLATDLGTRFAAGQITAHPWQDLQGVTTTSRRLVSAAAVIVNTTPVGMVPDIDASPWPADRPYPRDAVVYDLVYNPAETKFLRQARDAGCRIANGSGMLVRQGAEAFELWTGQVPDIRVMTEALLQR